MSPRHPTNIIDLAERAQAIALISSGCIAGEETEDFKRRARHAERLARRQRPQHEYGCDHPEEDAWRVRSLLMCRRKFYAAMELPDFELSAPFHDRYSVAVAEIEDPQGRTNVLPEVARLMVQFGKADTVTQGRMLVMALQGRQYTTEDGFEDHWAPFVAELAQNAAPESLVTDLNVLSKIVGRLGICGDWLTIRCWTHEGVQISISQVPFGIRLNLEFFESIAEAMAALIVVYCFVERAGITEADIRYL